MKQTQTAKGKETIIIGGDSATLFCQVITQDINENKVIADVENGTMYFALAKEMEEDVALVQKECLQSEDGIFYVTLDPSDTENLEGRFICQFKLVLDIAEGETAEYTRTYADVVIKKGIPQIEIEEVGN